MPIKNKLLKTIRKIIKPFLGHGFGRFFLFRSGYRFLIARFNPIEVHGQKMFIESSDGLELFIKPTHEEFELELFKKEIKKGDYILDIGAHIGYYSLIAAEIVGSQGKIFAFEPDPESFALLRKNIKINNYNNITPVQKAVSDENKKGKLYLDEKRARNRIYDSLENNRSIEIEVLKLDDFIKEKVDFIKMDIEGSEVFALKGMKSILDKNKQLKLMTEFYPILIRKSGSDPMDFLNLLKEHGFSINKINSEGKRIEPVKNLKEIINIKDYLNLFCHK